MITVRRIERFWEAKKYAALMDELLQNRPEHLLAGREQRVSLVRAASSAAVAMIRLDELSQSHTPLYRTLLRTVLACQEADGGWGDLVTSALCTRALLCGEGNGVAVERAIGYFVNHQKAEGIWPHEPLRRMPADPFVSAFILLELGDRPAFREAIRLNDAADWFEHNGEILCEDTRQLWPTARLRCRVHRITDAAVMAALWS